MLDEWVKNNPSKDGYFIVVQHDDNSYLRLPQNTIIYGACSGNIPLPLVYQDIEHKLEKIPRKSFNEKQILCSFVGSRSSNSVQPNVRLEMEKNLSLHKNFHLHFTSGWTAVVDNIKQNRFINITSNSKFALAPRGYGRSSFRFFEIFHLGTIPIYIWNDKDWLPFKDIIDYKFTYLD